MTTEADEGDSTLSPDDAFAVLGNETRMEILQTLGDADEPLSFSELRERVGVRDSGQFNYHLDKLVGHFLEATGSGYALRRAGQRIIEAVVSGAVTETPAIEPTQIDWPCTQCGAPVELSYQQEWVAVSCTECPGVYSGSMIEDESAPSEQLEHGYLGGLALPPAAIQGRSAIDVLRVAWTWDMLERLAASSGTCPRCSAPIEHSVDVCEEHDDSDGPCEECDSYYRVRSETTCTNCPFSQVGPLPTALNANTDLLAFMTSHGHNPVIPTPDFFLEMTDYDEAVLSMNPFEGRFTWTLDGDSFSITVDDDLNVVDIVEGPVSDPD